MPDKDLRKQALKGGKTTSRKAAVKSSLQSSPATSRPASAVGSRSASRVVSRDVSDDEDERLSDDTNLSVGSIDAVLESDDINEASIDVLEQDLNTIINDLIERKGSSTTGREDALTRYSRLLMSHYFADTLYGRVDQILAALSKSIKVESSSKEPILALRAVSLTAFSVDDSALYEKMSGLLKRTISDASDNTVKAAAIECLGICLTSGGAAGGEIAEICAYLLEIIQSDGAFVGADDNAAVVTAALTTYGALLTEIDDLEDESEDAVETLMEQLDSSDVNVLIAAGQAIALLFEKSYTERSGDSDTEDAEDSDETDPDEDPDVTEYFRKRIVKRYQPYHDPSSVADKVSALANLSTRSLNKNDKRKLHQAFSRISTTVSDARFSLQSANISVKVHREQEIRVDMWWKLLRLNAIRRVLGGGFLNHYYEGNKQLLGSMPLNLQGRRKGGSLGTPGRSGDKYRGVRRFVGVEGD